jgi:hypothetical protein
VVVRFFFLFVEFFIITVLKIINYNFKMKTEPNIERVVIMNNSIVITMSENRTKVICICRPCFIANWPDNIKPATES